MMYMMVTVFVSESSSMSCKAVLVSGRIIWADLCMCAHMV